MILPSRYMTQPLAPAGLTALRTAVVASGPTVETNTVLLMSASATLWSSASRLLSGAAA